MGIDEADAGAMEGFRFDETQDFLVRCYFRPRQLSEQFKNGLSVPEAAECKLAQHKGMHEDAAGFQEAGQLSSPVLR